MFNQLMMVSGEPNTAKNTDSNTGKGLTLFNADFGSLWRYGKLTTVSTIYLASFFGFLIFVAILMVFGVESTTWLKPEDIRVFFYIILSFLPLTLLFEGILRIKEYRNMEKQNGQENSQNRAQRKKRK